MEQRSTVPGWARDSGGPSQKQRDYIMGLIDKKEMTAEQRQWVLDNIDTMSPGREGQASRVIGRLLKLPDKPRTHHAHTGQPEGDTFVPAGRYAVENEDDELRFYLVWRPKDNENFVCLYVLHGPDQTRIKGKAIWTILRKIVEAGIEEAAIRFGREIGSCSQCGRRLTNRISRELGIGPVCGGRMFGDEFGEKVSTARQAIIDRGENPDEDIDDDPINYLSQEELGYPEQP